MQLLVENLATWKAIGPVIVNNLNFSIVGYPDLKKGSQNFDAALKDDENSFSFYLKPVLFNADLDRLYRTIGIPVTGEFVRDNFKLGSAALDEDRHAEALEALRKRNLFG